MKLGLAPLYALSCRGIGLGGQAKPSGRTREHPAACDCAIASCVAHTSCVLCGAHSLGWTGRPAGGPHTLLISCVPLLPSSPARSLPRPAGTMVGPCPRKGLQSPTAAVAGAGSCWVTLVRPPSPAPPTILRLVPARLVPHRWRCERVVECGGGEAVWWHASGWAGRPGEPAAPHSVPRSVLHHTVSRVFRRHACAGTTS